MLNFVDKRKCNKLNQAARCCKVFYFRLCVYCTYICKAFTVFIFSELDQDALNFAYLEEYLSPDVVGVPDG